MGESDHFECHDCGKVFNRKYNLRLHIESMHLYFDSCCSVCSRTFNSASGLQKHMIKGHNTWDLNFPECDFCGKTFTRKQNLISHMVTVHLRGVRTIKCTQCDKNFSTMRNLNRHNKLTHDPNTQFPTCNDCNKVFKAKHSLLAHIQTSHCEAQEDKIAKCDICNKVYTNHRNLKRHIETLHGNKVNVFSCELCPKSYTSNQSLKRHTKSRHDPDSVLQCLTCFQTYPSEVGLEYHEKTCHRPIEKYFQCEECDKSFLFPHKLKEHTIVCHNNTHSCPFCEKQFIIEPNLRQHIRTDHSFDCFYKYCKDSLIEHAEEEEDERSAVYFNCEFCHDVFNEMCYLESHIKTIHGKEFVLCNCNVCYTKFYSTESLLEHKKLCLIPEGVHSCSQCDKLFTERCSLEFHVRIFHAENESCDISSTNLLDEAPFIENAEFVDDPSLPMYKCPQCDRLYNSDRSLKHHIKLKHTSDGEVECTICGKICSNKYYLSSHLKIVHTTETISKCDYCDKLFKSKRNIRRHIEYTHLGMQRYKCVECDTLFKEKRSLRKHVRSKHPESASFPKCHICQKQFESAKSCKIHLKLIHSFNLNTHPCDLCSVSFGSYQALNMHLRTNHLAEDEIYKCEDCNEVFKGLGNFELHNETYHMSYSPKVRQKILPRCIICNKDFSTRKTLKRHLKKFHCELNVDELVEYGSKNHQINVECEECLRKFSDDFYYGIYLKLQHLRESIVFTCDECSYAYNTVEYSIQRYKLRLVDECRAKMILSEFCTAEMSDDEEDDEITLNNVMEPESTTNDIKIELDESVELESVNE